MTTLESLIRTIGNISRSERKIVRRYLVVRTLSSPNKMLKLFDLIFNNAGKDWSTTELEKRLDLQRHHAAFARLVSQLRKRVIEALSLPIVTTNDRYSERTKALFHIHRQYLKALTLFEAGDYESADEILLSLMSWANDFELFAERIIVVEFLMHIVRIYGQEEVLGYFKDVPQNSRQLMTLVASSESLRELTNHGQLKPVEHKYGELKWFAEKAQSARALFVLTGLEGKVAELRGDYLTAEKFFLEQLGYCNNEAVRSDEHRAQVYADIVQNEIHLKKFNVAKEYLEMAFRCKKKFKSTVIQLEQLKKGIELVN